MIGHPPHGAEEMLEVGDPFSPHPEVVGRQEMTSGGDGDVHLLRGGEEPGISPRRFMNRMKRKAAPEQREVFL